MSAILPWIRKRVKILKDSFALIVKGLIFCMLAFSGLNVAIILRILEYNGLTISLFGIITQFIALILCYFMFRNYLKVEEKEDTETYK